MDINGGSNYALLLDNLNSLIFVVDCENRVLLYGNKAFLSFMQADSCAGIPLAEFISSGNSDVRKYFLEGLIYEAEADSDFFCKKLLSWYNVNRKELLWEGTKATSFSVRNVTEKHRLEDENKIVELSYEISEKRLGTLMWEYDKEKHNSVLLRHPANINMTLPNDGGPIEDLPYSLVGTIDEKDVDKYIHMYKSIDEGAKFAETDIMLHGEGNKEARYEHIMLTSFTDYQGKEKVIGLAIDITTAQMEEEKYHRLKKQLEDAMDVSYESALLDLGQDLCLVHKGVNETVMQRHDSQTASGFLYAVGMDIGDSKLQSEFFEKFCIETMRLDFLNGIQQIYMEFPTSSTGIDMKWPRLTANLSMNPETSAVEALLYLNDISEEKKHSFIINALSSESFHYIAFVYSETDEIEFFSNSTDIYYLKENNGLNCYSVDQQLRMDSFMNDKDEAAAYKQMTSLETVKKALGEKKSYTVAFNINVAGTEKRLQLYYTWISEEMGLIMLLCMDITSSYAREKQYIKDLHKALEEAETAANSKMEFISRISHDIRTPLSAITSMTDFAFEDIDDKEKLRNDLEKINSSNHFLMSLINDVLDVSKIDSGRIELVPEVYPYEEFITDINNMFVPLCSQKGVTFKTNSQTHVPAIIIDKIRFNQVVLNLISNAYKYTPEGGSITVTTEVTRLPNAVASVDISIADTGIGMGKEFQQKMFTPFSQDLENPARQKLKSGTGIGLYIVKKLITLMGGTIDVSSELNKGTTMHVQVKAPYVEVENIATKPLPISKRKKLAGRVLLAEDNEINTEIALRTLHNMGLEADTAENGAIAVKRFEESEPGKYICILMDIQMPILSGYEAAEVIRALEREDAKTIPIFALSANAYSEAVQQSKLAGMNGHISKPIDTDILYRALMEVSLK